MAGQGKDPFEGLGQFADSFRKSPYFNPELAQQQNREEARQQLQQPEQQPQQESKKEADRAPELSSEDNDLAAKIRQIEAETRDDKTRKEKILALLKPRLGGVEPEKLVHVCHIPNKDTGTEWHTYYFSETGTPANITLPDQRVLPPHIAAVFTGGMLEPCLQHTIEFNIGVTGAYVSQKKILPYELLPSPAKNQQELERLVTAATQYYTLISKEIRLPAYMKERTRKIAAAVFNNAELYKNEKDRQQVAQLLQQIDNAISLRAEGKAGEEEVRTLLAKLREKPGMKAQAVAAATEATGQPLEQKVEEYYWNERYAIPSRLQNPEEVNLILRIVNVPYEIVLDAPPDFGMFRFTKPGYSGNDKMVNEATEVIPRLDRLIGMLRGTRTKEQLQQELPQVAQQAYEAMKKQPPAPPA